MQENNNNTEAMKAAGERLSVLIHEVTSTIVFFCGATADDTDYALDEKFKTRFKDFKKAVFENYDINKVYYRGLLAQLQSYSKKKDDENAGDNGTIPDRQTTPEDIPQE